MTSRVLASIRFAWVLVAVFALDAAPAFARTYSVLYAFQPPPREPSGKLLELADGYFLGTSLRGGAFGEGTIYLLYRQADNTWATYVIHSFSGPEGRRPAAGIVRGSDGNFYGTATRGGAFDEGTVFRLSLSGRVSLLHSFAGPDGAQPAELLVEAPDGSLWSTTDHGGRPLPDFGMGTIFRITKTGSLTTIHRFNRDDGEYPNALINGGDGFFYGSTRFGGTDPGATFRSGTLFKINLLGALTTLYSFTSYGSPGDVMVGGDGHLYGTGSDGGLADPPGSDGVGFVFRATRTGIVTPIHNFSFADGFWRPAQHIVQGLDGALYGGTSDSASGHGAMYRLMLDGGLTKVGDLGIPFGTDPSGLTRAGDGTIIATTRTGGLPLGLLTVGDGAGFTISASAPPTMLYSFSPPTPVLPTGALIEGPDGTLYGTSCVGGTYNAGTVFKFRAGVVETIHSFNGADGFCPVGGVRFGADGMLYGTTFLGSGGSSFPGGGTIFRTATTPGAFATLWSGSSPGAGSNPMSSPVLGPDGNIYIAAPGIFKGAFGATGAGAMLRVTPNLVATVVAEFSQDQGVGAWPVGSPLFASDGQIYGTTTYGESSGVYRMDSAGQLSSVAALSGPGAGYVSRSALVEGAAGSLIGVESGGAAGLGRVFSVSTTTGNVSTVHEFSAAEGPPPFGDLVDVGGGQFVGVTYGSKLITSGQHGTIYRVTAGGTFATLHRFSWIDGANPVSGLLLSADGSLYGTASSGGFGGGVIFRLTP